MITKRIIGAVLKVTALLLIISLASLLIAVLWKVLLTVGIILTIIAGAFKGFDYLAECWNSISFKEIAALFLRFK